MKPSAKIPDPDLREFSEEDATAERRSVIIELKPFPVDLKVESPQRSHDPRRRFVINSNPQQQINESAAMDTLESELSTLGLRPLVRLNSASAFVASLSPEELRTVSDLPLVGIIRPNTVHRVPKYS